MTIKIRFPHDELCRRSAKMLDVDVSDILSVCPAEGGRKFFVLYKFRNAFCSQYIAKDKCITFTIWQMVDALPLTDILGDKQSFWAKGLESILAILGLKEMPSNEAQIKAAYRKQAKAHHPDKGGNPDSFRELQLAYESLMESLPELRKV
jgi:hypothetical protein